MKGLCEHLPLTADSQNTFTASAMPSVSPGMFRMRVIDLDGGIIANSDLFSIGESAPFVSVVPGPELLSGN